METSKLFVKGVKYGEKKENKEEKKADAPPTTEEKKEENKADAQQSNYMNPTIASEAHRSIRARYLDKKNKLFEEEKKEEKVKEVKDDLEEDGYPKNRNEVVEQLKECRWKLKELTEQIAYITEEQIIAERSELTPEKVPPKTDEKKDSAKDLQQWYTIDELAEECIEKFKENCPGLWDNRTTYFVEPSAGEGDILLKLPKRRRKGVDVQPKNDKLEKMKGVTDRIEEMNFYETTRTNLGVPPGTKNLVLIGNPPFGDVASNFFDHATTKGLKKASQIGEEYEGPLNADYIAWILPNSFLSRGRRNNIDPLYHLIYVMNITCCYVFKGKLYNLATMFGIWKRETIPLLIPQTVLGNSDFELITNKEKKQMYANEKKVCEDKVTEGQTYFWMRKVVQHIDTKPQPPTHKTAQCLINTYKDSNKNNKWKEQKLLESFCIKCKTPELYDKVYKFFSEYDWATHIGQFVSGRSTKDWVPATRIVISKTMLYSAYNKDFGFRPYEDATTYGNAIEVIQEQSNILSSQHSKKGGGRKKRTKKKARRKRRKRSKRKYK